jgi:two-component system response regulator (stage 0 sporulation protein A)
MEKRKLLIAEGSDVLREMLADMFRGSYQIFCCATGYEVRELMQKVAPDLMVLDVMLPGIDGISLLQWARGQGIGSQVLVTTRLDSDYVMEAAAGLGAGYVMMKPYDLSALAARVEDLSRLLMPPVVSCTDPESQVTGMLRALGIQPKHRGFACLREAVLICAREEHQSVTKILYPEVARRCGCAASHVERNIRSAIQAAWTSRNESVWRLYFTPDSSGHISRPTNAAVISCLADSIRSQKSKNMDFAKEEQKMYKNIG